MGNSCSPPWTKAPAKPPSPAPAGHSRLQLSPAPLLRQSRLSPSLRLSPQPGEAARTRQPTTASDAPCRGGTNAAVGTRRGASGARRRHLFHLAAGSDRFCGLPAPPPSPIACGGDAGAPRTSGVPGREQPPSPALRQHLRLAPTAGGCRGAPTGLSPGPSGSGSLLFPDLFQTLLLLLTAVFSPSHSSQWHFLCLINAIVFEALFQQGCCTSLGTGRGSERVSAAPIPLSRSPASRRHPPRPSFPQCPAAAPALRPSPHGSAGTTPERSGARSPARASFAGRGAPSPESCPREGGVTAASGAAGASGQGKPGPRLPACALSGCAGPALGDWEEPESSGLRRGFPARAGGRGSAGRGETAHSGRDFPPGWRSPSPGSSWRPPPRSPHTLAGRAAAGLGWARLSGGGGGGRAGAPLPPWRRLPRGAPAPAALACPRSGAPGRGTGPGGRREPEALRRGYGADRGIAARQGPSALHSQPVPGPRRRPVPGDRSACGGAARTLLPGRTRTSGLCRCPFSLTYSCLPLPSPASPALCSAPRGVCACAGSGGRRGQSGAGSRGGACGV